MPKRGLDTSQIIVLQLFNTGTFGIIGSLGMPSMVKKSPKQTPANHQADCCTAAGTMRSKNARNTSVKKLQVAVLAYHY